MFKSYRKIQLISFLMNCSVIDSIILPFMLFSDLSVADFFLANGVFSITSILVSIPAAYIADTYGKKRVFVAGGVFYFLSALTLFNSQSLYAFALYQLFKSFAFNLINGVGKGYLAELSTINTFKRIYSDNMFYKRIGSIFGGALTSILIYTSGYELLTSVKLGLGVIVLMLTCTVPLSKSNKSKDERFGLVKTTKKSIKNKKLMNTVYQMALMSLGFFFIQHFAQPYFIQANISDEIFPIFTTALVVFTAISSKYADQMFASINYKLWGIIIFPIAALFIYFTDSYITIGFIFLCSFFRGPFILTMSDFTLDCPSKDRIIFDSINNTAYSLLCGMLVFLSSYLTDLYGFENSFIVIFIILSVLNTLYFFYNKRID